MSDQQPAIPTDAPWYVKTGMQTAMNFGVPTLMLLVIMVFLLAREMEWAPNPVADELEELKKVVAEGFAKIEKDMQQDAGHAIRHDATMQEMVKTLKEEADRNQMKCVLKAKTDDEKKACLHK